MAGPLGWRAAFLLEAAAMAPFVAFCALAPPIHLRGMSKGARRCVLPTASHSNLCHNPVLPHQTSLLLDNNALLCVFVPWQWLPCTQTVLTQSTSTSACAMMRRISLCNQG